MQERGNDFHHRTRDLISPFGLCETACTQTESCTLFGSASMDLFGTIVVESGQRETIITPKVNDYKSSTSAFCNRQQISFSA